MNRDEYISIKHEIHDLKENIINIVCDLNHADNCLVNTVKELLSKLEGNCLAAGEYYAEYLTRQDLANANLELIDMQKEWTKNNIKNDNKRTAVAEEQIKLQKASFELQSKILKTQEADKAESDKHCETLEKQNQKLITACESIAYSLAKLAVNSNIFDKNFKYMTPQKLDEFDIKKDIGDSEYRDKIGD